MNVKITIQKVIAMKAVIIFGEQNIRTFWMCLPITTHGSLLFTVIYFEILSWLLHFTSVYLLHRKNKN